MLRCAAVVISIIILDFARCGYCPIRCCSQNKRSFRGPGGVGNDLGSDGAARNCAQELASVVSQCLPLSPVVFDLMTYTVFQDMLIARYDPNVLYIWDCFAPAGKKMPLFTLMF